MTEHPMERLQSWYLANCDGEWEHKFGVTIQSLDNPGWWLKVDTRNTKKTLPDFDDGLQEESPESWIHCKAKDGKFECGCSPLRLGDAIELFFQKYESVR